MPNAEILAIGDELLSGETVDTNSSYLDGLLEGIGWTVSRHLTVPDDLEAIRGAFAEAAGRSDLVLSTGGLGPTRDDLTMQGLALALGCELRRDEPTIAAIKERFASFGREMTPNNERQAMVPSIGEVITNEIGTAPGFMAELSGASVYLMPGVPREVRWLMEHRIMSRIPPGDVLRLRRTIKVIGLGESRLEHSIRQIIKAHMKNVRFGFRTQGLENHIKLLAEGPERADHVARAESELVRELGPRVYGYDDDSLPEVVMRKLVAAGATIAFAESCTGGLVAKLLTDIPGASACFVGGVTAYANEAKVQVLGVKSETIEAHGAVSEETALEMAAGVRDRLGTTWGASTTGIAGPSGGTPDKPIGTVCIGVVGPDVAEARTIRLPGEREWVRSAGAKAALDLLRRCVDPRDVGAD